MPAGAQLPRHHTGNENITSSRTSSHSAPRDTPYNAVQSPEHLTYKPHPPLMAPLTQKGLSFILAPIAERQGVE